MKKTSLSRKLFLIADVLFLCLFTLMALYPIVHVIMASLSNGDLLMAHRGALLKPLGATLDAYKRVFENAMIMKGYLNTLFIVIVTLMLNFVMTSFAAYFLSRKYIYTRSIITFFIIFTMYFNGGTIPFYFAVKSLGIYDTHWAIILPAALSTYNVIILRTAFMSVPESLEEAARIDGANHFTILFNIILPVTKASLAVVVLYYLVAHWNSWFNAMIFLKTRDKYPLQLILREILIQNDTSDMTMGVGNDSMQAVSESVKYAVIVVSTLPVMMIYPFLQKYFEKGAMIGAVKG